MNDISKALLDLNIVKMNKGVYTTLLERASQSIVTGILLRLGFRVSVASGSGRSYDLIIPAYENLDAHPDKQVLLRAQVRTIRRPLSSIGGIRGAVNRTGIRGVKKYKYTEEHNDLVIGVDRDTLDLYLIPTVFLDHFGQSKSLNLLQPLRNNWDILLNWNETFISNLAAQMGFASRFILRSRVGEKG